tara:strand:+ start:243 stop:824 length:582 start_codon:yes stop_codon:yes gene_type:complete
MPVTINGNGSITGLAQGGIDGTKVLTTAAQPAGSTLQTFSTTKTDVTDNYTGSVAVWNTGLTVAITPSHANNKILIWGHIQIAIAGPQHNIGVLLNKDGTIIDGYRGDASGSRTRNGTLGHNMPDGGYDNYTAAIHFNYLDTAGSTSAITYGVSVRNPSGSARTIYMNRANTDTDNQYHYRTASTITVMEIKV